MQETDNAALTEPDMQLIRGFVKCQSKLKRQPLIESQEIQLMTLSWLMTESHTMCDVRFHGEKKKRRKKTIPLTQCPLPPKLTHPG